MKKSPTFLMKELKAVQTEIASIHKSDERDSSVPLDVDYTPRYESSYSYDGNRQKIKELQKREAEIHLALNKFNISAKVEGYDLTIAEALVKISQLRSEIKILTPMVDHQEIYYSGSAYNCYHSSDSVRKSCYDISKVKEDLKNLQHELSSLQVAVDKTNLNSLIDC